MKRKNVVLSVSLFPVISTLVCFFSNAGVRKSRTEAVPVECRLASFTQVLNNMFAHFTTFRIIFSHFFLNIWQLSDVGLRWLVWDAGDWLWIFSLLCLIDEPFPQSPESEEISLGAGKVADPSFYACLEGKISNI